MNKTIKILVYIFSFVFLLSWLSLCIYEPVPLKKSVSFNVNKKTIESIKFGSLNKATIQAGWARANITDVNSINFATIGMVGPYTSIEDSLFVNCIVLRSQVFSAVILSYDLLLVTPDLASKVKSSLRKQGITNVYFSASHTHSSYGGYGKGVVSKIALGSYEQATLNNLVEKSLLAYKNATEKTGELTELIFTEKTIDRCINRVTKENYVKENVRQIQLKTKTKKCVLSSLNVHPTFTWGKRNVISKDYPKIFSWSRTDNFGMFVAGTMGSIQPMTYRADTMQITEFQSVINNADYSVSDTVKKPTTFYYKSIPLITPKLAPILAKKISASSYLSAILIGSPKISIEVLRIGNVLMVALPCELSSFFYPAFKKIAEQKGLHVIVTSFNGTYLGYATPLEYFEIDHMETRTMNWVGKYSGDYFSELVQVIIKKQP